MKILVVDREALALDWIIRCINDGHKVKWFIPMTPLTEWKKVTEVGKGIKGLERIDDPSEWYRWADLIFFSDNTKYIKYADAWRNEGWPVICATEKCTMWETDRGIGQRIMAKAGIEVPPFKEFTNYDAAIAHVKSTMKRYVSKPNNSPDKALSYCSKSPQDMIYMLERWKKMDKLKGSFILQEFIPGIEMAVGAWFGPGGFNQGWCENWEFKKFMNDDMGVATGEQGTVLRYVAKSYLADKVLKPLEDILAKEGYLGYIDVNCIITDDGVPLPLEFTMRPGWPTFNIQQTLHKGDHAEWLLDLADGWDAKNWELNKVATGVVLSVPDYPYSHVTRRDVIGIPIYGVKDSTMPYLHFCQVMRGQAPNEKDGKIVSEEMWVTAGDYVLVGSGVGETIRDSQRGAYRVLKSLSVPNSPMYRTDIGNRLKKQLPLLQAMGYATKMTF
jgi:phosphoribosylamine--glycine ligase